MQGEVDRVADWSTQNGLNLNIGKCESYLFTPSTAEFKWTPKLTIADQTIKDTQNPRFLGISYDKMLTFSQHTEEITQKMSSRMCLLHKVGGADWGWSRESMKTVYTATQRSVADYGSVAWSPWISNTNMEKIERAQGRAARRITGATQSIPSEAVNREAGLEEMSTRFRRVAVCQYEKWRNLEEGDPRRAVADAEVRQRTRKKDWREQSRRIHGNIMRDIPEAEEGTVIMPHHGGPGSRER